MSGRTRRRIWSGLIAGLLFVVASATAVRAEPDFAGAARTAHERLARAVAVTAGAETEATPGDPPGEELILARSVARTIGLTELAALRERRGARSDSPADLLPVERRLVLACLRLEFDYARRAGIIQLAEFELARLQPWISAEEPAAWPALVEGVAAMDYHDEPEVPDGEEWLARASNDAPTPALFAAVESLARAHPDRLRAHFPRLILYRRAGREAELDRAVAEFGRHAPLNRTLRRLASDIRAFFAPLPPSALRAEKAPRSR